MKEWRLYIVKEWRLYIYISTIYIYRNICIVISIFYIYRNIYIYVKFTIRLKGKRNRVNNRQKGTQVLHRRFQIFGISFMIYFI